MRCLRRWTKNYERVLEPLAWLNRAMGQGERRMPAAHLPAREIRALAVTEATFVRPKD